MISFYIFCYPILTKCGGSEMQYEKSFCYNVESKRNMQKQSRKSTFVEEVNFL